MAISGYNLEKHDGQSLEECKMRCDQRVDCVSMDWRDVSYGYNCALGSIVASEAGNKYVSSTSWNYFEKITATTGNTKIYILFFHSFTLFKTFFSFKIVIPKRSIMSKH